MQTSILDYFSNPTRRRAAQGPGTARAINKSRLNEFRVAVEMLLTEGRLIRRPMARSNSKRSKGPSLRHDSPHGVRGRIFSAAILRPTPERAEADLRDARKTCTAPLTGDEVSLQIAASGSAPADSSAAG